MPQLSQMFFKFAVVFLLIGILMGLQISMSGNHNVIGAHAHTNLLGWVTSAIFGGYYALNPAKAETRLARIHFWVYAASVAVMVPSLYILYSGYPAIEPLLAISSLTGLGSVLMFAYVVFTRTASVPASKRTAGVATQREQVGLVHLGNGVIETSSFTAGSYLVSSRTRRCQLPVLPLPARIERTRRAN